MKQKLLKTIGLVLLCVVGASNVWADNISPTQDVFFRTSLSETTYSWASGYPKTAATVGDGNMAGNHRAGFFVLQKYSVENLKAAKSLVLHLHRYQGANGGDAIAIWAFGTNEWSESSTASDIAARVNGIVGLDLNTTGTPSNSPLVNGGSNDADSKFTFGSDALAAIKNAATYDGTTGTFTILLTNKTSDMTSSSSGDRKFDGSGNTTEANRPYIAVEYDPVVLDESGTISTYATLNAAFDAVTSSGAITLYDNASITSRCNTGSKAITVEAVKDDITISSTLASSLWLLNNTNGASLTIGSSSHQLTIDGTGISNSSNMLEGSTNGSTTTLNNVLFKNCTSTNDLGVVCAKNDGKIYIKDCAFDGCVANSGRGIVFCGVSDGVILSGNNTFTNCTDYDMYLEQRFQINETEGITNTTPVKIFAQENKIGLNNLVATKAHEDDVDRFFVMNPTYALFKKSGNTRDELKVCEGYTLNVTSAGAATLMLPFGATIPTGATCYTLTYTSGNNINAAEVTGGTLSANTPVLVTADEGLYKFKNSSNQTSATSYTASDTYTSGVLTGVFQETTVPANNYILTNHGGSIGFRKANGSTNKVQAYRAYMDVTYFAGAPEFFGINFDGETTAIDKVDVKKEMTGEVYNLQGIRMQGENLPKGIYVKNGKKFVVK